MSLTPRLLRTAIIEPCLNDMAKATGKAYLASPESVAMMLATAWVESGCGAAIAQAYRYEAGPAFGIWQIECRASRTAQDVLERYVIPNTPLLLLWQDWTGSGAIRMSMSPEALSRLLMANHHACCMLARLRYLDYEEVMPILSHDMQIWLVDAARTWANGYWRGADREAGMKKFRDKISSAPDVLAEIERIREAAVG